MSKTIKRIVPILIIPILLSLTVPISGAGDEQHWNCVKSPEEIGISVYTAMAPYDSAEGGEFVGATPTGITLDEFKVLYEEAGSENRGICDFEYGASEASTLVLNYGNGKSLKTVATSSDARYHSYITSEAPWNGYSFPSSGTYVAYTRGGNHTYTFTFSEIIGGEEGEKVTAFGFAALAADARDTLFSITANYDDNTSETFNSFYVWGMNQTAYNAGNLFLGFKAPEGCSIKSFTLNTGGGFAGWDDLGFITEDIPLPDGNRIQISGVSSVEQPPFMATTSYQYTADVIDQNGDNVDGTSVEWTTSSTAGISIDSNGILSLTRNSEMPAWVNVTATEVGNPQVSRTIIVRISPSAPYYSSDTINGDAPTGYTRQSFINDLEAAMADPSKDVSILNFNNSNLEISGNNAQITIPSYRGIDVKYRFPFNIKPAPTTSVSLNPSAGTHVTYSAPQPIKTLTIDESTLGGLRPVAMAAVLLNQGQVSVPVNVTFSDGTSKQITVTSPTTGRYNTFCGFKAPRGRYIKSINFTYSAWGFGIDEMGLILEEPIGWVELNSFEFKDYNNDVVKGPVEGGTVGKVSLTSFIKTETITNESLIVASYDSDGKMRSFKYVKLADVTPTYAQETAVGNIDLPTYGNGVVKAFLFENMVNIMPIASNLSLGKEAKIFVVGDSTAATYTHNGQGSVYPLTGWAQNLQNYFPGDKLEVVNYAISGASSKSFKSSTNYSKLVNEISAGDYLIIQFGHNDATQGDPNRYNRPTGGVFRRRFV